MEHCGDSPRMKNMEAQALRPLTPFRRAKEPHEQRLIARARDGSAEAAEALIRRYWSSAQRTAYLTTMDLSASEDVAQDALLSALGSLDGFDEHRPFAPWLHRIVVNRALDWARARTRRGEVGLSAEHLSVAEPVDVGLNAELLDALHALSPEHRAVVALRYLLGYGEAEVAELLELPRGTVGSRLRRALDQLREILGGDRK
jgi:RNA polymerase sigma-70 factor, ECF subfamily